MQLTERENILLCLNGEEPKWIPDYDMAHQIMCAPVIDRKLDSKTGYIVDVFGSEWKVMPDGPTPVSGETGEYILEDITEWEKIMPKLDMNSIDWENQAKQVMKTIDFENRLIVYHGAYIWDELHYIMGFENALVALVTEPDAVRDCLNAVADFWIDAMRHFYKYMKFDDATLFDHIATGKGLMMSPETYRNLIKPAQKRFVDAALELGVRPVIHSDGLIEEVIPDYAELGFKEIAPCQPFNDINKIKEKYGLATVGGWDYLGRGNKEDSTEEEVRASVREAMDKYGPGKKYVFWSSGINARLKNVVEWVHDEAKEYGKKFYRE